MEMSRNGKKTVQLNPEDHIWKISGRQYEVDWFKGNQLPESLIPIMKMMGIVGKANIVDGSQICYC